MLNIYEIQTGLHFPKLHIMIPSVPPSARLGAWSASGLLLITEAPSLDCGRPHQLTREVPLAATAGRGLAAGLGGGEGEATLLRGDGHTVRSLADGLLGCSEFRYWV